MNPIAGAVLLYVVSAIFGMIVFYLLVRVAVKHGVADALEENQRGL